jgi:hypothetical protein
MTSLQIMRVERKLWEILMKRLQVIQIPHKNTLKNRRYEKSKLEILKCPSLFVVYLIILFCTRII